MSHQKKEFGISSWAVDNRITVYILTFIIIVMGTMAYINMPRENFPEILENKIYISSVFPGNSSEDVEKLVVKPLEDQFKNISGVTKVTSSSFQDYGIVVVEFEQSISIEEAKIRIKDKTGIAKKIMVKVGKTSENFTEILSGLEPKTLVVGDGVKTVSEGMKLNF